MMYIQTVIDRIYSRAPGSAEPIEWLAAATKTRKDMTPTEKIDQDARLLINLFKTLRATFGRRDRFLTTDLVTKTIANYLTTCHKKGPSAFEL